MSKKRKFVRISNKQTPVVQKFIILVFATSLIFGFALVIRQVRTNQADILPGVTNKSLSDKVSPLDNPPTDEITITQAFIDKYPLPPTGYKQILNSKLQIGFYYPMSAEIQACCNDCDINLCQEINSGEITINAMYPFGTDDPIQTLKGSFNCDAGGPAGTVTCEVSKVELFENPNKLKVYKVYRNRIFNIETVWRRDVSDPVYVVVLPQVIKASDSHQYGQIILETFRPTTESHSTLIKIVNSMFAL